MNILPPHENPALIGHDEAIKQVAGAFVSGRMAHAWLITGAEGIGKATLAYHMAHYILSNGENRMGQLNMQHPAARLIAAEAHPDIFVVRRPVDEKTGTQKETIPVESARKIAAFLHKTASHGNWRVAIIDEAHALNRHGQNAILKVIEEPPPQSVIILTATTTGALVPTIRSRCRHLPLQPLNEVSLRAVLARCGLNLAEEELSSLIILSEGSAGFALRLAETQALPVFSELEEMLRNPRRMDTRKIHILADRIGKKSEAESFNVITRLLVGLLKQNVKIIAMRNKKDAALDHAMHLWDKVRRTFEEAAAANLDRKLAFVNAMTEIRKSGTME